MALLRLPGISLQILGHQSDQKCPNLKFSLNNCSLSWSTAAPCRLHHRHGTFTDSVPAKPRSSFTTYFSATTQEPILESPSSTSAEISTTEVPVEEISKTRLIAQNVPWAATPEDIRSLFEKYGNVVDVEMSMHKKERNRGLVFIEMGSPEEAAAALSSLESYEFEGRSLKVNYAKSKKKKSAPREKPTPVPTFNLFVANLAFEARAKHLKEFFDLGSGNVVSTEVIFHENPRRSSGYGFVSFKTKKQAEAALIDFQGKELMGRPIRVARSKQFVKLQAKEGLQPPNEDEEEEEEEEPSQPDEMTQAEDASAAEN